MLWLEQLKAWLSASREIAESVQPGVEVLPGKQVEQLRNELAAQPIPELYCQALRGRD